MLVEQDRKRKRLAESASITAVDNSGDGQAKAAKPASLVTKSLASR